MIWPIFPGGSKLEIHINDLSINAQYGSAYEFRVALEPLLRFRIQNPQLATRIFCSKTFSSRPVSLVLNVQQAVRATHDQRYVGLVLAWLSKGPFWDDERHSNPDDYFHFEGTDVTDQGLGEAARRIISGTDAGCFSFLDITKHFVSTPLRVNHGLEEEPIDVINVPNHWAVESLPAVMVPLPQSWDEFLHAARLKFSGLIFSADILQFLGKVPFDAGIVDLVFERLRVLQELYLATDENCALSDSGLELLQMHFTGDKAWFSDESEDNKRYFKREMTFSDPADEDKPIFAPWHGKVKKGQFRIHFEWPRPKNQRQLKVLYVGPKLTKR